MSALSQQEPSQIRSCVTVASQVMSHYNDDKLLGNSFRRQLLPLDVPSLLGVKNFMRF